MDDREQNGNYLRNTVINRLASFIDSLKINFDSLHANMMCDSMRSYFSDQSENYLLYYEQEMVQEIILDLEHLEEALVSFKEARNLIENKSLITEILAHSLTYYSITSNAKTSPFIECYIISSFLRLIRFLDDDMLNYTDEVVTRLVDGCKEQKHALYERRRRLIKKDIYGFVNLSDWEKEKIEFSQKLLEVRGDGIIEGVMGFCFISILANNVIDSCIDGADIGFDDDSIDECNIIATSYSKGIGYESECIASFQEGGWLAMETSQTGDRGADIIATKRGFRIVAQCKNWSSKIDTSAIQEISTAKLYYEADFAVLICETTPTKQAKEMSEKLKILIINKTDIPEIEVIMIKHLLKS
ncbi:hypothetical protein PS710_03223 [Pseudomonas fluorescens]|uniref:Restriction endonuclease type IV Mrr domain-containing protein n=2 Tax=Pseudomonas fluorescens TaxID=294 RepID=A0A5E7CTW4_PSEFL|nr:hypothetical protein PS710_03223 [Pseudomonas fluorescens]